MTLIDILGREVERLVDEEQEAGEKFIMVDASKLSTGIYFYRLTAGAFRDIKKMVVLK